MNKQVEDNEKLSKESPQEEKKEKDEEQKPKDSDKVSRIFEVKQGLLAHRQTTKLIHDAVVF